MKAIKLIFIVLIFFTINVSCSSYHYGSVKAKKLDKLELGMSKAEVSFILGTKYYISKKELNNQNVIEVISYENFPHDEVFLFTFRNDELISWEREFKPKYKEVTK